jgi:branched-chain amino acid transport system permease protein
MIEQWRAGIKNGFIFGIVGLFLALVGIIEVFDRRWLIDDTISMSYAVLLLVLASAGFTVSPTPGVRPNPVVRAARRGVAGLVAATPLALLVLLAGNLDLRSILVNVTPALLALLTFDYPPTVGAPLLLLAGLGAGLLGGLLKIAPSRLRRAFLIGLAGLFIFSVLNELIDVLLTSLGSPRAVNRLMFSRDGLTPLGAVLGFALVAIGSAIWPSTRQRLDHRYARMGLQQRTWLRAVGGVFLLAFLLSVPQLFQLYWTDVMDNIGLYILMGLGLNIVVGYAGLLDLGYVAFFAIGAYVMGLLTSPVSSLGLGLSFWVAWPITMVVGAIAGVLLGFPVLRMRGDYLAIVTLGFGEIIRVLATSDLLKPYIGGAQGILQIPKPTFFGTELITSQQIYYLILAGCGVALFASWRLSNSRVGRAWIAMREDEDVAQAIGINLINYKLLAFATGATFSAMSGAIFATKLSSIFPHSFNLLISINVLSLIIVGGLGSIPGVIVGALILVGLPEVLREFTEYRLMLYGATLVIMMLMRPEGFWPAARRRLELHKETADRAVGEVQYGIAEGTQSN